MEDLDPFAKFFNLILHNPALVPGDCWDLNGQLEEYLPPGLTDFRICVLYQKVDNQLCYIVERRVPRDPGPSWRLLLHDPISVIQIFRCHHKSTIFNITRHFLYHGIPFSTIIPKSALPPPLPYRDAPTLGWCPHGYEVKAFKYAFYHDKLHLFFKQSYSHAALSMGGIVWCLAHAMVNDDLVDSVVVNGPSDAAGKQCSSVEFTNGEILCDDNLTEGELDFICGVYKVATATGKITTFSFCS